MPNPLTPQGSLNRIKATVNWSSFPSLNVTPDFLGPAGISLSFDGVATTFLPSLTGYVTSPEPYQGVMLTINLLKTQNLAVLYEQQRLLNSLLQNGNVYPDVQSGGIGVYNILNCGIENVAALSFAGTDAGYNVSIKGYYPINSSLFN